MIFYFTGTGNSLFVASKIHEVEDGKLIDMALGLNEKNFEYKIEKGEKIGIVFPVYYWGLPTIVSEFMNKLKLEVDETPFIYTVITCAGKARNADKYLAKILESKNLELNSSYSVKMPSNYIILHDTPAKEEINSSLAIAEEEIEKLIEEIKNNKKGFFADHGAVSFLSFFMQKLYEVFRRTKKFYVTEECTNCGLCENTCPSRVIHIRNGKPEWMGKKCSHCSRCINCCPSRAIEYGNSTKKRKRYINPQIKFSSK
ncbi:MAG: EFR1 family ferrodoxin [Methanobrevibacter sp.]|nr:EFR1 family ferrodoxin [Methanobrevibacter sp.]